MITVCYERCWPCKYGQHFSPPEPHPWWDVEDVEYAAEEGHPAPTGVCACSCAVTARLSTHSGGCWQWHPDCAAIKGEDT